MGRVMEKRVPDPLSPSRIINFGSLIHGSLGNAEQILGGFSWSSGVQVNPFAGYLAVWNSNGVLGGPTVGVPGGQVAGSYSGCGNLYSFLQSLF